MRPWRAGLVAIGVLGLLALARPPAGDAARRRRIGRYVRAYARWLDVPRIEPEALRRRLERGEPLLIVDVRSAAERAVSKLPGAVAAAEATPEALAGREVVSYCTLGFRSSLWARARRAEGQDVHDLHGGVLAWTHVGGPLVADGRPTRRVHVHGRPWDLVRSDHHPTW